MATRRASSLLLKAAQLQRSGGRFVPPAGYGSFESIPRSPWERFIPCEQVDGGVSLPAFSRAYSAAAVPTKDLKIVGVLYKAGEYAKNPRFLGCAENALGLRDWLEGLGHKFIVTDDKDGPDSELEKLIPDMDILITTPFHPAYMTPERLRKAKKLRWAHTAGVGSDHIDLAVAADQGVTVTEVSGSNTSSVAEDELLRILLLLRNFLPAHQQITDDKWQVAACASKAYDLKDKVIATVGAGRIGYELLKRLKPCDCKELIYWDRQPMSEEKQKETGARREEDFDALLAQADVVVINVPLTTRTSGLFNKETIAKMKKGSYIVNNARGAIVDAEAIKRACESGHLAGYSGDVWSQQPPPADHPWRHMPNHAMTPHFSGTTLDAQARYAAGTKQMLELYFEGKPFPEANVIVKGGKLAGQYV
ncbi:unnamed protein product [Calypogeia fissa]